MRTETAMRKNVVIEDPQHLVPTCDDDDYYKIYLYLYYIIVYM